MLGIAFGPFTDAGVGLTLQLWETEAVITEGYPPDPEPELDDGYAAFTADCKSGRMEPVGT